MNPLRDPDPRRFRALMKRRLALFALGLSLTVLAARAALAQALAAPL